MDVNNTTAMSEENLNFDGYACSKALSVDSKPEDCRKLYAAWSETYDNVCIYCENSGRILLNGLITIDSGISFGRCENPEHRNITEFRGIYRNITEFRGISRNFAEYHGISWFMSNVPLCFVYPHTYNSYQYRVILGWSHFLLAGTVSTSPNLAKEGARSATIIRDLTIYRTATRRQRQENTLRCSLVKHRSCLSSIA